MDLNTSTSTKTFEKYSIIVPSFNRAEEIHELLESFTDLELPQKEIELLIADDGSTDSTSEIVSNYQSKFSFTIKFLYQQNKGPGAARNMGMENATGDFFIFIDSDCTVHPKWLVNIDQKLHSENADAFGGPDSFRENFPALLKAINYSMTSFITTGGLRGSKGKKLAKFYPRSFNMGLSRKLYKQIGGFGKLRHGQDIEYSNRIIKSGAKVIFISDAIVYHKRRTSIRKFFRQVFNWGVARINLYKLDKSMLEPLHGAPAFATVLLFIMVLLSIISTPFWLVIRWLFLTGLIILLLSALHAAIQYKEGRMLYLIPIIMPIQIIGYGAGFITAFLYRIILGKDEFVGFHKRYYK